MASLTRVFVYGLILDSNFRRGVEARPAVLDGYRLAFYDSLATVEEAPGEKVWGACLEVAPERFDRMEGCYPEAMERGLYRREIVTLQDGAEAWVFMKNRNYDTTIPDVSYVDSIKRGYREFDHPAEAYTRLDALGTREHRWHA